MVTLFNVPVKRMLVVALVVLIGCRDSDKNSSLIFEELNESLERSNKVIDNSSKETLRHLKNKIQEPAMAGKIVVWLQIADSIYSKAKSLIVFVDGLKSNLKQKRIEIGPNTSNNLYQKLMTYKGFIEKNNSEYKTGYNGEIEILDKGIKDETDFYKINFLDKSATEIFTSLSKLENNILITTNNMMGFCDNQATFLNCGIIGKSEPVAVINSTKLGKGEELVINAGIGEFTLKGRPSFEINGVKVEPNINGVGEYKMKIKSNPGKYKAHVKIKYTNPDGRKDVLEKDIEYTVVE